ncbi:unnamed protein product [Trifolium pratense]|uniref:Uncharacterized protein n=1 Tax=Trifolium pratense TaxID=57577 RepID=A0ACB0INN8_TRIPR|nr:unnamed protein product [Trifolium pratense]
MLIYDGLHYDALAMSPVEVALRILIRPYLRYKKTEALDLSRRLL